MWFISKRRISVSDALHHHTTTLHLQHAFFQQQNKQVKKTEAWIILAIEAIWMSQKLSCWAAVKIYNVPELTLRYRINGRILKTDFRPAVQNLTEIEEDVIVQYILNLDLQGFLPLIKDIYVIVNYILMLQSMQYVRKLWPNCIIQ